ncbi:MAG: aggregation factor core [Pseudomonadota bacterium]
MTSKFPAKPLFGAFIAAALSTAAHADIVVTFDEGAPKDRFTVENVGTCALTDAVVTIDLSGSASGLVFDVTESGAGVEVFQPFELVAGADLLSGTPTVSDGDNRVDMNVRSLGAGRQIAFTVDVDDTVGTRQITVSNSEIEGATVSVTSGDVTQAAMFGQRADARVSLSCG